MIEAFETLDTCRLKVIQNLDNTQKFFSFSPYQKLLFIREMIQNSGSLNFSTSL